MVDSEDVDVVSKLGSKTTAFGCFFLLRFVLPVNPESLDLTAGDSWAFGTILL